MHFEAGRKVPRRRFGDSSIDIDLNYLNIQLLSYLNYPQLPITINIAASFFLIYLNFLILRLRQSVSISTISSRQIYLQSYFQTIHSHKSSQKSPSIDFSLLLTPYSLLLTPYSLLLTPYSQRYISAQAQTHQLDYDDRK